MAFSGPFYLHNVLVTPDIIQNLLLLVVSLLTIGVKNLSSQNVIARCNSSGALYTMRMPSHSTPSPCAPPAVVLAASASTWHRRLGHPGVDALSKLSSDSSVVCSRRTHDFCHAC
jgi:hypothetical protein